MYKSVVFDAYGTLFDVFSVAQKCESMYPGKGDEISQIWRQKQLEYSWLLTLMEHYKNFWEVTKDALTYALDSLNLSYDSNKIADIMNSYYNLSVYPEVTKAIPKFYPAKLAILTNGNKEMFEQLLLHTGLDQQLDCFLSADTVKLYKPRPEVYQLAVDQFLPDYQELQRKDILFVSSNSWDIAGAKTYGFTVAWINRSKKTFEHLGVKPDYVVSDLLELAEEIQ